MELAGELVAGRFFSGVNSLQFAPASIEVSLDEAGAEKGLFVVNAADPACLLGMDIEGLFPDGFSLPSRIPSSHLYFRGAELIALSERGGKGLSIRIPPDDPCLSLLAGLVSLPRLRAVRKEIKIVVETINGASASRSAYAEAFRAEGFLVDRGRLVLW
jgi:hypothetical protein